MHQATNSKKELAIAWLELSNAFGSIPHDAIIQSLRGFGLPEEFTSIVLDLYSDTSTTVRVSGFIAESIPVGSGVKQGDPLSPILFNLAMEPLIRAIKSRFKEPLKIHDVPIQLPAFADDLALVAKNGEELIKMLNSITSKQNNQFMK